MRIRIGHLLLLMGLSAIGCLLVECFLYRTAVFRVDTVIPIDDSCFRMDFEVTDGDYPWLQTGTASVCYGDNSFFKKQLSSTSFESLPGTSIKIRYLDRDFLWLKHYGWGEIVSDHFPDVIIWPNAEDATATRMAAENNVNLFMSSPQ